jgi:hypothetical protein
MEKKLDKNKNLNIKKQTNISYLIIRSGAVSLGKEGSCELTSKQIIDF